ncbi:MAG: hypothetical protein Q3985_04480 [Eubacteriales bacterium]|nr:hypothetical protein [Eubacteriales bacterium]
MYEAEKQVGVTSTYYFRFSTIDNKLIKDMIMDHFNVGLHFETIADYIAESGCNNKYDINMDEMRMRFKKDIERFEKETGVKVRSVCSHGHELNQKLGISNNAITEDQDLSEYGIIFEAYEREMYENDVDCHIMDAHLHKNFGFSYKDNPYDAIEIGYQNIVFLSHPHNWYMPLKSRIRSLKAIIVGKASYSSEKTFNRIAK